MSGTDGKQETPRPALSEEEVKRGYERWPLTEAFIGAMMHQAQTWLDTDAQWRMLQGHLKLDTAAGQLVAMQSMLRDVLVGSLKDVHPMLRRLTLMEVCCIMNHLRARALRELELNPALPRMVGS